MPRLVTPNSEQNTAPAAPTADVYTFPRQRGDAARPAPQTAPAVLGFAAPEHELAMPCRGPLTGARADVLMFGAANEDGVPPAPAPQPVAARRDALHMLTGYLLGLTMTVTGAAMTLEGSDLVVRVFEGAAIGTFAIAIPVAIALAAEALCRARGA